MRGWPLAVACLLAALALGAALVAQAADGRLVWRRTALDLPLLGLFALVGAQLALGHGPLVAWALAPGAVPADLVAEFPAPWFGVGTVGRRRTLEALLLFAAYVAVYYAVVHLVRVRRQVGLFVRALVLGAGLVAFAALIDYLSGHAWLLAGGRDRPLGSRLAGTFDNPDHFAAWLALPMLLGLGWLAARVEDARRAPGLRALASGRELREQAVRRWLPLVGVVVAAVALVFTLSRGAILNLAAALLAFLLLLTIAGRGRRSLVLTGALLVGVGAYGGWIGLAPLLERLEHAGHAFGERWTGMVTSLAMLTDFPLLGVGLGGYTAISFRYQPQALQPETVHWNQAHNDLVQLALELGPLGVVLVLFAAWRVVADLIAAHLGGRGACPVDGGEGDAARRSDRYSVGIAVGALAGLAGLVVHSAFDFSMRKPAVGFMAAALLGLATVALHTRLVPRQEQLLTAAAALSLRGRTRPAAVAVVAAALLVLGGWTAWWLRAGFVGHAEARLAALSGPAAAVEAETILALDPASVPALRTRALASHRAALDAWFGPPAGLDRAAVARRHLAEARGDLRAALAVAPTNPYLHNTLAWVEAAQAVVEGRRGPEGLAPALAQEARALALARDNAVFYAAMARLAASTAPEVGLRAGREALARRPELLPGLLEVFRPLGLTEAEWLALVPERALDRLALARQLEARGLPAEGLAAYRAALERAAPAEAPVYRWALGVALGRRGLDAEAVATLRAAREADPMNPEVETALGEALARLGDPAALAHLRRAVALGVATAAPERVPFGAREGRLAALVRGLAPDLGEPVRYRRALARHLTARGLWEQALAEWEGIAAARPRDGEARFGVGRALEATGAGELALEAYRAAVLLDGRAEHRARLAALLWKSEQYFQAINEWRAIVAQQPTNVEARLALARALERVGQRVDAYRAYREILAIRPGDPAATQALARLGRGG